MASSAAPVLALVLLAMGACGDSAAPTAPAMQPAIDPLPYPVDQPGPFAIGYRELSTTYTPPGGLPPRTIPVGIWYPAQPSMGDSPRYGDFIDDPLTVVNAPLAATTFAAGYPLLVHSHGDAAFAGSNAHVIRHLASHGWVVVEPNHVGNTLSDEIQPHPLAIFLERPLDVRAAVDLALALPAGDPLAGKLDPSRIAVSGHSFGTYTSWAVSGTHFDIDALRQSCQRGEIADCSEPLLAAFAGDLAEHRARAIIPMAGGANSYFGKNPYNPLQLPVLLMVGSLNESGSGGLFAAQSGFDFSWVEIDGGCHELFNLGNNALGDHGNDSGGAIHCSALPDADGFAIVNTWLLAYLRYHLLGDRTPQVAAIVGGQKAVPRSTLHHK